MAARTAAAALITALLILPRSVSAQTTWEVAAGYAYLQDPPDRTDFPAGWMADAAVGVNGWLSAVADAGRSAHSTLDIDLSTSALLGGVRASARIGRLTEFAQLLGGLARSTSTVVGVSASDNHFAIQPGAGVDFPFRRRLAGRLQVDYRAIRGGVGSPIADPRHQFRLVGAVVYRRR